MMVVFKEVPAQFLQFSTRYVIGMTETACQDHRGGKSIDCSRVHKAQAIACTAALNWESGLSVKERVWV